MTNYSATRSRTPLMAMAMFLVCGFSLTNQLPTACAQESPDKANQLLDQIKLRSPEERWQRVKKRYPADAAVSAPKSQSRPATAQPQGLSDAEIPPSPEQSQLIPRLSTLPVDTSNDWVLPTRDPAQVLEDFHPEATAKALARSDAKVVDPSDADVKTPSPAPLDDHTKAVIADEASGTRNPRKRSMKDIEPYYDRNRDSDIREFAVEKGKEFGILFKPHEFTERSFPEVVFAWEPTNFFYHPLYFSDPALERYGHAHNHLIQPIASIARFGTQFIMLPYQMTIDPPCKPEYALGWYKPGDCAPKLIYQIPLNAQAAAVEAGVLTGLFYAIP